MAAENGLRGKSKRNRGSARKIIADVSERNVMRVVVLTIYFAPCHTFRVFLRRDFREDGGGIQGRYDEF